MNVLNENAKVKIKEGRKIKKRIAKIEKTIEKKKRTSGSLDNLFGELYHLKAKLESTVTN
jgi:hypothetical protein